MFTWSHISIGMIVIVFIFSHYINNGLSDMSLMLVMVLEMSHFKIIKTNCIPLVV